MNAEPNSPLSPAELTRKALTILNRELGLADTLRFIHQFSNGSGDYTAERDEMFKDLTLDQILAETRAKKRPPAA